MSGVNQHHLPQFLMRGFAVRSGSKNNPIYKAVEHHKERGIGHLRNIKHIGAQRIFYGKPGPGTLDDAIDRLESKLAPVIRLIGLGQQPLRPEDVATIASLLAHLVTRAKQIRSFMAEALTEGAHLMWDLSNNRDFMSQAWKMLGRAELEVLMDQTLAERGIAVPPHKREEIMGLMFQELPKLSTDPHTQAAIGNTLRQEIARHVGEISQRAEAAHHKMLTQGLDPALRVAHFQTFSWSVVHYPGAALILPDMPVIAFLPDGSGTTSMVRKDGCEPTMLVLPIATDRALLGTLGDAPAPTPEAINETGAQFASEFFVAKEATPATEALVARIGTSPSLFDDPVWQEARSNALTGSNFEDDGERDAG